MATANPWNYTPPTPNQGGWGAMDPSNPKNVNFMGMDVPTNPYYGLPDMPTYGSSYDPNTMSMTPDLMKQLNAIQMDKSGLNKFRSEALRNGPSTWAQLATQQQRAGESNARERGANEVAGQTAQTEADLAARGGLTSGARERAAEGGAKNYMAMSQDLARQGNLNELQIGVNDEQNRMQQLGMLPGMEQAAIQPEMQKSQMWEQARSTDINAQTAENNRINEYNKWKAEQQQQAWATNQQANATIQASKPSCWLISAIARFAKLPQDEPELLTKFKLHVLRRDKEGAKFYIRRCGPLIPRMDAAGFDWKGFEWYNTALMTLMRAGEHDAAYELFRTVLTDLVTKYWPDCPHKFFDTLKEHRAQMLEADKAIRAPKLSEKEKGLAEVCLQNLQKENFQ